MNLVCPKGHVSTDADFCSECGTPMQKGASVLRGVPASATPPAAAGGNAQNCPDCLTPRPAGARFCEVCRYDFVAGKSFSGLAASTPGEASTPPPVASTVTGDDTTPSPAADTPAAITAAPTADRVSDDLVETDIALAAATAAASAPAGVAAVPASSADVGAQRLKLRIVVDASLYVEPSPDTPCPIDTPPKVFHLDLDENTLGRQYEGKGIHPEIVIHDPGISRRHLKFVRTASGGYTALELGSSNGTLHNGAPLDAGIEKPVKPGDQFTLGMWTRVFVEAR
ncbi:FHA domain-containing protein [Trinickia fusca]|uniref:FHA domain-containing protein n=1 Tax=Trinickia fusca TaxID=2419777 RepID=A0A494XQS4_9BURK|nr:FHA domain-containing protein [Trinickia fusca]RKP50529.1 FHA domain-containing protein [Trinickia fusca]